MKRERSDRKKVNHFQIGQSWKTYSFGKLDGIFPKCSLVSKQFVKDLNRVVSAGNCLIVLYE